MRGDNYRALALELRNNILEAQALFRIETRGRLVEYNDIRLTEQSLSYAQPAYHAARKGLDLFVELVLKTDKFDIFFRLIADFFAADALEVCEHLHHFKGGQFLIETEFLRQIAYMALKVFVL